MAARLNKLNKERVGFTLVELMITIAIVGVLAVIATFAVRKYVANAKTAEARNALGEISKDAARHYMQPASITTVLGKGVTASTKAGLCQSASSSVPSSGTTPKGVKYQSNVSEWNGAMNPVIGWYCLQFEIDLPQYYLYTYTATGTSGNVGDTFTATANGDLNGDGVLSTFTLVGAINSSYVLNIAPSINAVKATE